LRKGIESNYKAIARDTINSKERLQEWEEMFAAINTTGD
jgi:hypothetical protein